MGRRRHESDNRVRVASISERESQTSAQRRADVFSDVGPLLSSSAGRPAERARSKVKSDFSNERMRKNLNLRGRGRRKELLVFSLLDARLLQAERTNDDSSEVHRFRATFHRATTSSDNKPPPPSTSCQRKHSSARLGAKAALLEFHSNARSLARNNKSIRCEQQIHRSRHPKVCRNVRSTIGSSELIDAITPRPFHRSDIGPRGRLSNHGQQTAELIVDLKASSLFIRAPRLCKCLNLSPRFDVAKRNQEARLMIVMIIV